MPESDTGKTAFRCGYVGIIGRPNVGKSTLLNHILGMKLSITSRKPQTTRHQILGIKTSKRVQAVYVDTPGIHQRRNSAINRYMNRAATSVLADVDVILFVIQANKWLDEDQVVLDRLRDLSVPVVLIINKIDLLDNIDKLLPMVEEYASRFKFVEIIPVSALKNTGVQQVENVVAKFLPENPAYFQDDQITDRSTRFLAAEIIREKLVRELGQELPYTSAVSIDKFEEETSIVRIHATIYVENKGQKAIVIGSKGAGLKKIGSHARADIETMVGNKVYLNLWVKIRSGWSNDEQALAGLGYGGED